MSTWLLRTHFKARQEAIVPQNSAQQKVAKTCLFKIGDVVDVWDIDENGNIVGVLANNLTVLGIVPDQEIALSSAVDTSLATETPYLVNQSLRNGQQAVERALCRDTLNADIAFNLVQLILDKGVDEPIVGKTTYDIADSEFWRAGDLVDIFDDTGLIASDLVIDSVNINADDTLNKSTIVVNASQDVNLGNNPFLLNKTITATKAIRRNQERIDQIDRPIKNELNGVGDGAMTCFKTVNLFLKNSTDVLLDGNKKTLGTAGTRASLVQGAGDAALTFTSMILGTLGNEVEIQVQAGSGFTINVSKTFKATADGSSYAQSQYLIQINDNGGTATSQQIAEAINAHSIAQRIVQVQWGGNGTGIVAPFGPTNLSGGADDGTGQYAELEQVFENSIITTGYKFISFHIRADEVNKMSEPPSDFEDIVFAYSRAHDNADI